MINNQVNLIGIITSEFTYDHSVKGEDFYKFFLSSMRKSEKIDELPVIISSKIFDVTRDMRGYEVEVTGSFRSYDLRANGKHRVSLYVFTDYIRFTNDLDYNEVLIEGFICTKPVLRTTPMGRQLTDVCIAVNRKFNKSDYIPVIFWSRNAIEVSNQPVGTQLKVRGRLQSRVYTKYIDDIPEERIAYEVSASNLQVIHETAAV